MATKKTHSGEKRTKVGSYRSIELMMNPKSVAVIGASNNPDKIGHIILQNYLDDGYSGKIYPINNKQRGEIIGLKAYSNIRDVKAPIDLAVIAVPAPVVPSVVKDCGIAGVKSAIVVSGGFAEVGNVKLQEEMMAVAKKYSIPMIGPNCLGVTNPRSRVNTMFLPSFKLDKPKIGGVSFASQSGAVGSSIFDLIAHEGFGLAKFISYGNAADIDEVDIIEYLANDKDTKVIVFYLEGVRRGREFFEAAKRASQVKPTVIIKGGITEEGAQAAHSHTASLAGSYEAYKAMFEQAGFAIAKDMQELLDYAKIFDTQPLTTGSRIAVITNGGGAGVIATDAIYQNGLSIATLSKESDAVLRKAMPPIVNIRQPLDMAGDADDKRFSAALSTISADPNVDAIIVIVLFQTPGADSRVAATVSHYNGVIKKPMVVVSIGGSYTEVHKNMLESTGVPVYSSPDSAARSLAALIKYSKYRKGVL